VTESLPQQPPEDLPDYGLLSDDGNARLHVLVRGVAAAVESGEVERAEAAVALADGVRELSAGSPEVGDVTVRDAILRELKPTFDAVGWEALEPFEF
jgi:hypothetical protein